MSLIRLEDILPERSTTETRLAKPPEDDGWNFLDTMALSEPLPPIPWLCESLRLAPGAVTMVAGYGYSRKTMALQSLALSVAAGKPVWGVFGCLEGRIVHLDYEQGRRMTQERYQRLARGMSFELMDLPARQMQVACMPRRYLATQADVDSLMRYVDGASFVLVDSLHPSTGGADENSSDIRTHLDMLSRLSERTTATIALIHHAGKPASDGSARKAKHAPRGSSALFDACQTVYVFDGEKNQPTVVHHEKDRVMGSTLDDFALTAEDVEGPSGSRHALRMVHMEPEQIAEMESERRETRAASAAEEARKAIIARLRKSSFVGSKPDMQKALGGRRETIYQALDLLVVDGLVACEGRRGSMTWKLT